MCAGGRSRKSDQVHLLEAENLTLVPRCKPQDPFGQLIVPQRGLQPCLAQHVPRGGIGLAESFAVLVSGVVRIPVGDLPQHLQSLAQGLAAGMVTGELEFHPRRKTVENGRTSVTNERLGFLILKTEVMGGRG